MAFELRNSRTAKRPRPQPRVKQPSGMSASLELSMHSAIASTLEVSISSAKNSAVPDWRDWSDTVFRIVKRFSSAASSAEFEASCRNLQYKSERPTGIFESPPSNT